MSFPIASDAAEAPPAMSVVLLVDRRRERGARALGSLLRQTVIDRLEIVLLDFGGPRIPPLPGSEHPRVRTIRLRRGLPYGVAKLIGFRAARAPLVAFTEEHCLYSAQWAEALLAEFADSRVGAVSGEMHNATPGRGMSDAIAIAIAGPWAAPARPGPARALSSNNAVYRRAVLERRAADLDRLLRAEPLLLAWLRAEGYHLRIIPGAKYAHEFEAVLSDYLVPRFLHDRVTVATRAEMEAWGQGRRLLFVAITLPWLAARLVWKPLRLARRPGVGWRVVPAIPAIVVGEAAALAGMAVGALRGLGRADITLLDYDLNARRSVIERQVGPRPFL
ncbi:MAG: glycosyltransferase [Chloroflexota bacterium]|nr:glycosyltransferase [Dehalococcoidia bacterium]MDW8252619.1 glycosyltransferase [Chloroflexota bacterium]